MEIKFKVQLSRYKYLIMFDLASKLSGVCVWDIKLCRPLETRKISVSGNGELPVAELYDLIDRFFNDLYLQGITKQELLVSCEAAPAQMASHSGSTIQTFMALARSHAALDLYLYRHDIDVYDYVGVYPITTHAYYKKLNGLDNNQKVTKEDMRSYSEKKYGMEGLSLDESDSVFLAETLVESKWNRDIDDHIKDLKRHKKTLTASHAIRNIEREIEILQQNKI